MKKKINTIFTRKAAITALCAATMAIGVASCTKGTFDVNDVNPNSPTSAPAKYSLSSSLAATASLVQGGNADVLENWMGYWTQSGGFTPSTTYVLYQLTSSNFTGNFDSAYLNLSNYNLLLKTVGTDPAQANYRAIGMIMQAYVFQRMVDLYNSVPYSEALSSNPQFSFKYDDPKVIYAALVSKVDSAAAIIDANPTASSPGTYDIVFGGTMANWKKFAKTLKLKLLMRQTENGLGSAGVKSALTSATAADFLTVDAAANPGYSNASDGQLNPFYYDVVANAQGANGANTTYWRANDFAVKFYQNNNDLRGLCIYAPIGTEAAKYAGPPQTDLSKIRGRVYGKENGNGESNSAISAVLGTGFTAAGVQKGPSQAAVLLPASEALFLLAEAQNRGYISGDAGATFNAAVSESFRFYGVTNSTAAATAYTSQTNVLTNYAYATDKLTALITQKWASMNSVDPLESYSDWRRLTIPANLPVSIYPGNTAPHIPYRLPYPINETSLNGANVPTGGAANDVFTSKIFWMK